LVSVTPYYFFFNHQVLAGALNRAFRGFIIADQIASRSSPCALAGLFIHPTDETE
jgi:hypothetical protein